MVHQETEGLLSPFIRDIRLRRAASHIKRDSIVLDMACGGGYLSKFLPAGCKYYGVDRVPSPTAVHFTDFLALDLLEENSFDRIQEWLPHKPDYITCIAFLEHIDNPERFIRQCRGLLSMNGRRFIGTTPHPRGRLVHEFLSRIYLCSRHGAEEHEDFLRQKDIERIASTSGGNLAVYSQFLFGLNQLFVIEYPMTSIDET